MDRFHTNTMAVEKEKNLMQWKYNFRSFIKSGISSKQCPVNIAVQFSSVRFGGFTIWVNCAASPHPESNFDSFFFLSIYLSIFVSFVILGNTIEL